MAKTEVQVAGPVTGELVIDYSITNEQLEKLRTDYCDLDAKVDYDAVKMALAVCRSLRSGVEKKRKELVADSVKWQKSVNKEANRVKGLIAAVEDPLKLSKKAVDDAKEAARLAEIKRKEQEEAAARQAELDAIQEGRNKLAQEKREIEKLRGAIREKVVDEPEDQLCDDLLGKEKEVSEDGIESPTQSHTTITNDEINVLEKWLVMCRDTRPAMKSDGARNTVLRVLAFLQHELDEMPEPQKPLVI